MATWDFHPWVFEQETIADARAVILNPEAGLTTDERWDQETKWLAQRIKARGQTIDYGCGIGRMVPYVDGPVLGVDIAPTMRSMATLELAYNPSFGVVTPECLRTLVSAGFHADTAIAIWVLQHAGDPRQDISLLYAALRQGGSLWVANQDKRLVPYKSDRGEFAWLPDDEDIYAILGEMFTLVNLEKLPTTLCAPGATLRHYRKR